MKTEGCCVALVNDDDTFESPGKRWKLIRARNISATSLLRLVICN